MSASFAGLFLLVAAPQIDQVDTARSTATCQPTRSSDADRSKPVDTDGTSAPVCSTPPPASSSLADGQADADIIVSTNRHPAIDPLRGANAISSDAAQIADRALLGPMAMGYKRAIPSPIRDGIRNALANLREPVVAIAYLLQLKPGKSAETVGRLVVNSTIGIGGLFDIAKRRPFNLPRRRNGLADTLGYYGVGPGPFLFLPLVGPTTVRDLAGDIVDRLFLPLAIGRPFNRRAFTLPANLLRTLDHRAEFDDQLHALRDNNPDSYVTLRDYYLRRRQAEIDGLRGRSTHDSGSIASSTLFDDRALPASSGTLSIVDQHPITPPMPTG